MNYGYIGQAVEFYKARGYVYVDDAPWLVGANAYYATKPAGSTDISVNDGSVYGDGTRVEKFAVASGEQSFIQMLLDGQPLKRAICVTPCHRVERRFDVWHQPFFMKAELINAHDVDLGHLIHMVHEACSFFEMFFKEVRIVEPPDAPGTFDIVEKDTRRELGSYGIRKIYRYGTPADSYELKWIYGTGCAEPRMSSVGAVRHRLR